MLIMALDIEELKSTLPKRHQSKVTPEFLEEFNKLIDDPDYGEFYSRNLVGFSSVLADGKFKLADYFNAVAFVSHKMLGSTNLDAYGKVFPQKLKRLHARNTDLKSLYAYASAYNTNKLVTMVYNQTLMADYIVYASVRHKAIRKQVELLDHVNPHVAQRAADSLMTHLKAPVDTKMTIDIGTKDGGVIADLANALSNLSNTQRGLIIDGSANAKDIAHQAIVVSCNEDDDYA